MLNDKTYAMLILVGSLKSVSVRVRAKHFTLQKGEKESDISALFGESCLVEMSLIDASEKRSDDFVAIKISVMYHGDHAPKVETVTVAELQAEKVGLAFSLSNRIVKLMR